MRGDVVFLALPLLVAVAGSILLWLLARARQRRAPDAHGHLRAFRYRDGATPPPEPSGIVPQNPDPEQ